MNTLSEHLMHSFRMPNGRTLEIETSTGDGATRVSVTQRIESATEYAQRRARENDARAFSVQLNGSGVMS